MTTEANISNPPITVFIVTGSTKRITEVIAQKSLSGENIREAVEDSTYFCAVV